MHNRGKAIRLISFEVTALKTAYSIFPNGTLTGKEAIALKSRCKQMQVISFGLHAHGITQPRISPVDGEPWHHAISNGETAASTKCV